MSKKKKPRRRTPVQAGLDKILHGIRLGDLFGELQTLTLTLIDPSHNFGGLIIRRDATSVTIELLEADGGDFLIKFSHLAYEPQSVRIVEYSESIARFAAIVNIAATEGHGGTGHADRFWTEGNQLFTDPDYDFTIRPIINRLTLALKAGGWKVAGLQASLSVV